MSHRATAESVFARIDFEGDCWEWLGGHGSRGYGSVGWHGKIKRAHRLVYELLVGEIPEDRVLDHLCRNKNCVNPDHLEPVTQAENCHRGAVGTQWSSRARCSAGHSYAENGIAGEKPGWRRCRPCLRAADRRHRLRRQMAVAA